MPILAAGQRRYLIDKGLVYLFSYDLPWTPPPLRDDEPSKEFGFIPVPGGLRLESHLQPSGSAPARATAQRPTAAAPLPFAPWKVYHVHDDISVEGNDAISGSVRMYRDSLFLPRGDRYGTVDGAVVIETSDQAVIDARFRGSISLGSLGVGHFDQATRDDGHDTADWGDTGSTPTRVKVFITPRFETAYPKYKWLTERQCAGFGVVDIEEGWPKRATIDIYALKSEPVR